MVTGGLALSRVSRKTERCCNEPPTLFGNRRRRAQIGQPDDWRSQSIWSDFLGGIAADSTISVAQAYRRMAGGRIHGLVPPRDDVERTLVTLAENVYATMLLPADDADPFRSAGHGPGAAAAASSRATSAPTSSARPGGARPASGLVKKHPTTRRGVHPSPARLNEGRPYDERDTSVGGTGVNNGPHPVVDSTSRSGDDEQHADIRSSHDQHAGLLEASPSPYSPEQSSPPCEGIGRPCRYGTVGA